MLKKSIWRQIILFSLVAWSESSLAASFNFFKDSNWFAEVSAGPVWESAGEKQTLNLAPSIQKTYTADNDTDFVPEIELFLGLLTPINDRFQTQWGIAVSAAASADPSGNIWDDADPQFNNYDYSYKVNHIYVGPKAKLLFATRYVGFFPWISATLGWGFNNAYHFNNTPTIPEAIKNSNFANNSETSFSYALGIGFQYAVQKDWQIGVGYEFADWGSSKLGAAPGQTTGSGLSLQHLYTNGLLVNITYLATCQG